uniref:Uncharacterized protein MANES_09G135500 n=1 Tax=Rhizophora mucronata TaxID=61149 RepID=A0A2P2MNU2_RHIMU
MSSFVCSPTHLSERSLDDRFVNEGPIARVSDYSVSSGGDQTRSGMVSPNFQKDIAFSSAPNQHSSDILVDHMQHQTTNLLYEKNFRRDAVRILQHQRTSSLGSTHAFDSNATCFKPYNSGNSVEFVLEPEKAVGMPRNKLPGFPPSFAPTSDGCLDLFNPSVVPESHSPVALAIDLFQKPAESPANMVDLFEESPSNPVPSMNTSQPSLSPALDLFSGHPVTICNEKTTEQLFSKIEGWATFDSPQPVTSTSGNENLMPSGIPSNVCSSAEIAQASSLTTNLQWPTFPKYSIQRPSPLSYPWHDNLHSIQASGGTAGAQTWNALDNSVTHLPKESINQNHELQDFAKDRIQKPASYGGVLSSSGPLDNAMGPSYAPPVHPLMEEIKSHTTDRRSTNPFDFPYDSESEPGNALDMSSLQTALPDTHLPSTLLGNVTQPWFPQEPIASYIPGGLAIYGRASAKSTVSHEESRGTARQKQGERTEKRGRRKGCHCF